MSESDNKPSVYLPHARESEQRARMEDIAERGICFMCPQHIPEFFEEQGDLIDEGEHSYLVHNGFKYPSAEYHIMAIPKDHVTSLNDLSDEFILEAFSFFRRIEEELGVTGGVTAMRFGNPEETGATAHHLHMHFIVPRKDLGPDDERLVFHMSPYFEPGTPIH